MRTEVRVINGRPVRVTICPPGSAIRGPEAPTVRARGGKASGGRKWEDHESRMVADGKSWGRPRDRRRPTGPALRGF